MAVHIGIDAMPLYSIADEKHSELNHSDTFDVADDHENDSIHSNLSDSGTEDDDSVFRFDKKSSSYGSARRFFNKSSSKTWKGNKKSSISEDTSKEFLTLQFHDDENAMSDSEKVAVRKGKSLKESIESLLHERGIDFSTHSVFLESSKTPLPLAFDTFPLGGNVLHVKENVSMQVDERIITLMKSAEDDRRMQNQRPKKNLMSSIFNDDVEVSSVNNKSQSITRKSGVASGYNKDESNRTLTDLLNHYTFNHFNNENEVDGCENNLEDTFLEESWTDVITDYEGMTNKDKIQQETIWELLITERNYLRKIRVIIVVFKNCLLSLQKESYLEDVDINKLFANIKEVYDTNYTFWESHLKHVTEEARYTKQPIKPSQLHDSFACFEDLFQPYIRYCMEEGSCMKYLKQLKRENEMFQEYLAWCENHRQCMRLKLADLFVKPMQRVTKYALLLKAILGKTTEEEEKVSLENMIFQVDRFVTKINTTLRFRNEQQKLDDILERIEMYVPIEAANEEMEKLLESQYCNFDLHGNIPGLPEEEPRCILLDGPMKMIEKQGRSDVHAFLFTDVLVLAKSKKGTDKFRVIRQPFRLNKVTLHRSKDVGAFIFIYLNEYGVLVTAFTLQVSSSEQTKWVTAIEKAKKRYENARAAKGSTLAFFDDDFTTSTSALVTSIASTVSPVVDRRSIVSDDSRLDTSSINKDELRCRSTDAVTRSYQKPEDVISDSHVKRSFSDPKAGISYSVRERSSSKQKGRQRPKSLVNISDHDIATWVLTNENRNQSGSITSDISDDSQRSSGIGDSFRSINSDGGLIMTYSNTPEMSKVAQLKARFENQGCDSPVNTEGSDSSLSTPSVLGFAEASPAIAGARRISPPDYMDDHLTIKEEEEQCPNNIDRLNSVLGSIADSDKDTENDSSESLRTINDGENSLRLSNRSFENIKFVKIPLNLSYASTASQTEMDLSTGLVNIRDVQEFGIQCDLLVPNQYSRHVVTNDFVSDRVEGQVDVHTHKTIDVSNNFLPIEMSDDSPERENIKINGVLETVATPDNTEQKATSDVFENTTTVVGEHSKIFDSSENLTTVDPSESVTAVNGSESVTTINGSENTTKIDVTENTSKIDVTGNVVNVYLHGNIAPVDVSANLMTCDVYSNVATVGISENMTALQIDENMAEVDFEVTDDIIDEANENLDREDECDNTESSSICSIVEISKPFLVDAFTQCEEESIDLEYRSDGYVTELKLLSDSSTQYEALCCKDTSTQCGDFIQLSGAIDKDDCVAEKPRSPVKHKTNEIRNFNVNFNCPSRPLFKNSLSDEGPNGRSVSPFMDMLLQPNRPLSAQTHRKPPCTLKHSFSEANISTATAISHSRSRSDEPQQTSLPNSPEHKHRSCAPSSEFPGMRALQTLSESLESSLQHRLESPCNSKPIVKHYDDDISVKSDNNRNNTNSLSHPILVRHNSSSASSLRKLAIMNNSPLISKKDLDESDANESESLEVDSFNEDSIMLSPAGQSSPKLRNKITFDESRNTAASNNSKRFTWHDFDSLTALRRIEQTKYGPSGRASTLPLAKNLSKSTEIISSSKKSSFKRSIMKRFTDVLNRSDESRSSLNHSREMDDDKSLKKKQKKEKKKLKKEKRQKEKEDKKRESSTKLRSSSVSSGNSRNSIPLSSTNSYGSFGSHTSSGNSR